MKAKIFYVVLVSIIGLILADSVYLAATKQEKPFTR